MPDNKIPTAAYVKIIEQPHQLTRFRYEVENKGGSMMGQSSTPENRTFPEIEICGYQGEAVLVVSCVTKDPPYLAHPHKLMGPSCKNGVCAASITPKTGMRFVMKKIRIHCVKRKEILGSLAERHAVRVDPFKNGFTNRRVCKPSIADFNSLRLCFQAFLKQEQGGKTVTTPLTPVVSDAIGARNALVALTIVELSCCVGRADGGEKMILFCEKVDKNDIMIHFFEEDEDGQRIWEAEGMFQPTNVHKQCGISFKTPPYRNQLIREPVRVYLQLFRPSDRAVGSPVSFEYIPVTNPVTDNKCKRKRFDIDESAQRILNQVPEQDWEIMNNIFEMSLLKENVLTNCDNNLNFNFIQDYCGLYPEIVNIPAALPNVELRYNNNQVDFNQFNPEPSAPKQNLPEEIHNNTERPFWNLPIENKENHPPPTNQIPLGNLLSLTSDVLINQVDLLDDIGSIDFKSLSLTDL